MTNKFLGYLEFASNHRDISQYHGSRSFKAEFTMESTSVRKMKGKIINELKRREMREIRKKENKIREPAQSFPSPRHDSSRRDKRKKRSR